MPRRTPARTLAACTLALGLTAAGTAAAAPDPRQQSLRELAEQHGLHLGVAVTPEHFDEAPYTRVAAEEYTALTHENDLKWESVQPRPGEFDFDGADEVMEAAHAHDQQVHGHTLVWHSQLPAWMEEGDFTPGELRATMREHIGATMGRYAGDIATWDVVNEPIGDDAQWRDSVFHEVLGPDFVAESFHMAAEADPQAQLFLNDYSIDGVNDKSDVYYELAADLVARGVPIDGIGLQSHLVVGEVPSDMRENMERFADLGLQVMITELDVRVPESATEQDLAQQAEDYREVLELCLQVDACSGVSVWGVTDAYSWVPGHFPGEGAALPFDEDYAPKPAYWALHEALGGEGEPAHR